jgi:hypothetical protein
VIRSMTFPELWNEILAARGPRRLRNPARSLEEVLAMRERRKLGLNGHG